MKAIPTRVLVVDDERFFREAIRELLEGERDRQLLLRPRTVTRTRERPRQYRVTDDLELACFAEQFRCRSQHALADRD